MNRNHLNVLLWKAWTLYLKGKGLSNFYWVVGLYKIKKFFYFTMAFVSSRKIQNFKPFFLFQIVFWMLVTDYIVSEYILNVFL